MESELELALLDRDDAILAAERADAKYAALEEHARRSLHTVEHLLAKAKLSKLNRVSLGFLRVSAYTALGEDVPEQPRKPVRKYTNKSGSRRKGK